MSDTVPAIPLAPAPTNVTIDKEFASNEFDRWTDAMDLDLDPNDMDQDDKDGFMKQKRRIIKAMISGSLVINTVGEAVYTPTNPKTKHKDAITFHERTGASLMAMDGKKKGHDVTKMYAVLSNMCGVHQAVFAGMVGVDVKTCEALFSLLMD